MRGTKSPEPATCTDGPPQLTDDECLRWLWTLRYATNGTDAVCTKCRTSRKFHRLRARRAYACDVCGAHVHPTAGTFLEGSNLGLATWFRAIPMVLDSSGSVPAKRMAAELTVSYQTALRMKKKITRVLEAGGSGAELLAKLRSAAMSPPNPAAERQSAALPPTVEKIRAAACRAFAEYGLASTRVLDIAREAGVSTASIHYYFGSKEQVLLAALDWSTEQNVNRLRQIDQETHDPLGTLVAALNTTLPGGGMPQDDWLLWLEVYVNVRHYPKLLEARQSLASVWTDFLAEVIDEGEKLGIFHPVAPAREVALGLTAMLDGLGFKAVAGFGHLDSAQVTTILLRFAAHQLGIPLASMRVAP